MTDKILFPSELGADFLQPGASLRTKPRKKKIMGILKDTFELVSKLAFLCPDSPMADFSPAFVRTLVAEGVTNGDPKFGAYLLDAATDILSAQPEAGTADIKRWLESVAANRSDNDALRLSAAKAGFRSC